MSLPRALYSWNQAPLRATHAACSTAGALPGTHKMLNKRGGKPGHQAEARVGRTGWNGGSEQAGQVDWELGRPRRSAWRRKQD